MMKIKKIISLLMCCILLLSCSIICNAKTLENEKVYNPLDLVVVVDTSGSMNTSDKNKTALDAVRMLVNMMPAEDSRVGIVGFNTKATVLTKNSSGSDSLISLKDFAGVETIRNDVSNVKYNGGTGIGNAVYSATELLSKCSDNNHTKAIILFTDGVNDFGYDKYALSACDENEVKAISWAKDNNCVIYCVGYDYTTSSGTSSMGTGGEGLKKLQNIAGNTNGTCKAIHNISDIEQLLIDFLADVCDLNYKTIATIPGDGGFHECKIAVSPSVVEANIRIAGGGANSIKNGKIKLYDPAGKEIKLTNSGNVRYDDDATAASIKVIMPKTGEWLLTVDGISGDDIHVGLLEHFKMNLTSQLIFPEGNPEGVAYTNDVIGIKTWLTYEDVALDNDEIYDAVTSATAVCVSRANPNDKKTIKLTREGKSFVGKFTIPEDCFYDITIRLDWDTVYREDTLTVASSNSAPKPKGKIKDVRVNKGKTVSIDNIYQYVSDEENDKIIASISNISSPDVADITLDEDSSSIKITGKKWSSTHVTIIYKDEQGNTVEQSFNVKVNDPIAIALIIFGILLIIAIFLFILYILYKKTFKIRGRIRVALIEEREDGKSTVSIFEDKNRRYKDPTKATKMESFSDFGNSGFGDGGFSPFDSSDSFPGFDSSSASASSFDSDDTNTGFGFGFSDDSQSFSEQSLITEEVNSVEYDLLDSFSNGEMQLGSIVNKKNDNLHTVLDEFVKRLRYHMSSAGNLENSVLVEKIESYIKYNFSEFSNLKIEGSRFGRQGIVIKNKSKQTINFQSPRMIKNKLSTKPFGRNLVVLKISIPIVSENQTNKKTEAYIEIEYINN